MPIVKIQHQVLSSIRIDFWIKFIKEKSLEHNESWYDDTWASIIADDGSVQTLDWLDQYTKDVFKTAPEIDQRWIIELDFRSSKVCRSSQLALIYFLDLMLA